MVKNFKNLDKSPKDKLRDEDLLVENMTKPLVGHCVFCTLMEKGFDDEGEDEKFQILFEDDQCVIVVD